MKTMCVCGFDCTEFVAHHEIPSAAQFNCPNCEIPLHVPVEPTAMSTDRVPESSPAAPEQTLLETEEEARTGRDNGATVLRLQSVLTGANTAGPRETLHRAQCCLEEAKEVVISWRSSLQEITTSFAPRGSIVPE